jgi:hypothetical protein
LTPPWCQLRRGRALRRAVLRGPRERRCPRHGVTACTSCACAGQTPVHAMAAAVIANAKSLMSNSGLDHTAGAALHDGTLLFPSSLTGRVHPSRLHHPHRLRCAQEIDQRLRCFDVLRAGHDRRGKHDGVLEIARQGPNDVDTSDGDQLLDYMHTDFALAIRNQGANRCGAFPDGEIPSSISRRWQCRSDRAPWRNGFRLRRHSRGRHRRSSSQRAACVSKLPAMRYRAWVHLAERPRRCPRSQAPSRCLQRPCRLR